MAKLGDLGDIFIGLTYKPDDVVDENGTIVLRSSNIQNGHLDYEEIVRVSCPIKEKLWVKENDILMCTRNGSSRLVGKTAFIENLLEPMTFGAFMTIIRTPYNRYIQHFFNSPMFRNQLNSSATTTINQITKNMLDSIDIPLPDTATQRQIAANLDKVTHTIDLCNAILEKLDLLVKSRFVEMFGDTFLNPYKWNKIKIQKAVTVEPQNGLYKPQSDYVDNGEGIPILRIDGFYNGKIVDFSNLKRLNCSDDEKNKYLLIEDDIVINRVNSIEHLGKCAHIKGLLEDTVFESNMMRMHFAVDRFNPVYVTQLLCSSFIYDQVLSHAKKAVNQASINQKDVLDFDIYVPPLALQNQFAAFVEQTDKSKLAVKRVLEKAETLKKALMQEYFG